MIAALALAAVVASATAGGGSPDILPLRRMALIAGANDGGPARAPLHYARTDAERFAQVLQRLGGLAPEDTILLLDPTEGTLRAGLDAMSARVAEARKATRVELLLYYSGHSDEEGLLLRGSRMPYGELRHWLEQSRANVRIAILDSCSSGALTREKGGVRAPPFLVDTSSQVTGHAILTSSAADEASQESDRIEASFFTYYLVTGLRGAADASTDGRVTLSEAYQYAFQETLARTERTRSGAQHPNYDIQLVGSGDVVLTELRGTGAALVLPGPLSGHFFVRDGRERLVAELRKAPGRPIELQMEPGEYRVTREQGGGLAETRVALAPSARVALDPGGLVTVARELTARRGDGEDLAQVPVDLSIFPPVSLNGDRPAVNRLQLGLIAARATRLRGVGIAPVLWADEDVHGVQLAGVGSSVRSELVGAQLSSVANVAGEVIGVQISGYLNLSRGPVSGAQVSDANWALGRVRGAQMGMVNYASAATGFQGALVNVAGDVRGAQFSLVGVARNFAGAQIGLVNIGGDVTGAQIGLVNVARRARGLQLGLINLAEELDGAPVGLLSVARDGEHRLLLLGDERGVSSLDLLLGSRWFHGVLLGGLQPVGRGSGPRWWYGAGFGVHFPRNRWALDVDLLGTRQVGPGDTGYLSTLRVLFGYRLLPRLELVGGPTANFFLSGPDGREPDTGLGLDRGIAPSDTRRGRVWLGFALGLRI
jgi:hypothetical protein